MTKLPSPRLTWRDDGSPVSADFDDIYFSVEDGLSETEHVFLTGNGLPNAWTSRPHFTIGETGFGTGLNFLATWAKWRQTALPHQHLHYVSVEGYPLTREELARALSKWPSLSELSAALLVQYPEPMRGAHHLHLADNVHLTLLEDDARAALGNFSGVIDAWFLDGFSPAQNPDMWSPELFEQLARLSHKDTSLATFTVAGVVRRGLTDAGFQVEKVKGHGRKREMLTGVFTQTLPPRPERPWFHIPKPAVADKSVAIIGAGIAGAAAAHSLTRAGFAVTVFDAAGVGACASGNPAGLVMPRLAADESADGRFHAAAYLHTERFLSALDDADIFHQTGVLQLARSQDEAKRFEMIATLEHLPETHMRLLTPDDVALTAEVDTAHPALLFPKAGIVRPERLLKSLLGECDMRIARVSRLERDKDCWSLITDGHERVGPFDLVVLACGTAMTQFEHTQHLPLEPIQGQISVAARVTLPALALPLSRGSYALTLPNGETLFGATYKRVRDTSETCPTDDAHLHNIAALRDMLPRQRSSIEALAPSALSGRVAYRAQVPDRIPFAGPAPDFKAYHSVYDRLRHGDRFADYPLSPCHDGLYLIGGLGARGFSTALLLGDVLAAEMSGTPLPLGNDLMEAIHPARFIIRSLRKNA